LFNSKLTRQKLGFNTPLRDVTSCIALNLFVFNFIETVFLKINNNFINILKVEL